MRTIWLCLCAMCAMCGCNYMVPSIPGSGTIQTETRTLDSFSELAVSGRAQINITAGGDAVQCQVACDDNLLPFITTQVVGNQLRIQPSKAIAPTARLKIEIMVPEISKIELAGAGDVHITGLSQDSLIVGLAGSQQLECHGQVDKVQIKSAGSATIRAGELKAKSMTIEIAGSADAEVDVSDNLSVEIAGSGKVRYRGDPKVSQSIAGSGKIEKL